jgi:hypothetical protein
MHQVEITDISSEAFQAVLIYLYTDTVDQSLTAADAVELYTAAVCDVASRFRSFRHFCAIIHETVALIIHVSSVIHRTSTH